MLKIPPWKIQSLSQVKPVDNRIKKDMSEYDLRTIRDDLVEDIRLMEHLLYRKRERLHDFDMIVMPAGK